MFCTAKTFSMLSSVCNDSDDLLSGKLYVLTTHEKRNGWSASHLLWPSDCWSGMLREFGIETGFVFTAADRQIRSHNGPRLVFVHCSERIDNRSQRWQIVDILHCVRCMEFYRVNQSCGYLRPINLIFPIRTWTKLPHHITHIDFRKLDKHSNHLARIPFFRIIRQRHHQSQVVRSKPNENFCNWRSLSRTPFKTLTLTYRKAIRPAPFSTLPFPKCGFLSPVYHSSIRQKSSNSMAPIPAFSMEMKFCKFYEMGEIWESICIFDFDTLFFFLWKYKPLIFVDIQ